MKPPPRLLKLRQVLELVPVSRSTWYAGIQAGRFPAPVKLPGGDSVFWLLSDIVKLINAAK
jgi:prophage regulatory protein